MNLAHLFLRIARRDPDAPAVAVGAKTLWTYAELVARAAISQPVSSTGSVVLTATGSRS